MTVLRRLLSPCSVVLLALRLGLLLSRHEKGEKMEEEREKGM